MRIPTGVPGFDALVQGGLPGGSAVVVQGPSGREKDAFLIQFIAEGLRAGAGVLVLVSSVSPSSYQRKLREAGVDVDRAIAENRLKFVDWFTYKEEAVQDVEEEGPVLRASIDLANVGIAISRAIAGLPHDGEKRAVLEILSPALGMYDLPAVYGFAQSTKAKLARFDFTSLFALEKEMHDERTLSSLHQPFDGVVDIERTREGDALQRKIAILSLDGTVASSKYVPIELGGDHVLRVSSGPVGAPDRIPREVTGEPKPDDSTLGIPPGHIEGKSDEPEGTPETDEADRKSESTGEDARRFKAEVLESIGRPEGEGAPGSPSPASKDDTALHEDAVLDRLIRNPQDAEALFVKAAGQAKAKDLPGAIETLAKVAAIDEKHPGLWIFKAKLHTQRGERDAARAARKTAEEIEALESELGGNNPPGESSQVPGGSECPECGATVREKDLACSICGVLLDLAEAVDEGREVSPPKPAPKRKRQGLVNGLVNGLGKGQAPRGARRTNGLVNGTRGRTNGLVNGNRGRTNGLVNGNRGRTNGLVNGNRGRTNGLVNGTRGRTNGLVNGLASLKEGIINGLTNGGVTDGLGSGRFHWEERRPRWKLHLIPLAAMALLLAPLLLSSGPPSPTYPITIDGNFADWPAASLVTQAVGGPEPNVDIVRFGVRDNVDFLAFALQVTGTALRGGDSPPTTDQVRVFLDADRDSTTGYRIEGLGADRLVELAGWRGVVNASTLLVWNGSADPYDWRGWVAGEHVQAAASGGRMEMQVEWASLSPTREAVFAIAHVQGYAGAVDAIDGPIPSRGPRLGVSQIPLVNETIAGSGVRLLRLDVSALDAGAMLSGVTITLTGSAPATSATRLRLVDATNAVLDERSPVSRRVPFSFPEQRLSAGTSLQLFVFADVAAANGDTLGAIVAEPSDVLAPDAAVTVRLLPSPREVGYLGALPPAPRIDGGFAEWNASILDPQGDNGILMRRDADLTGFAVQPAGSAAHFMAQVDGRLLAGTWVVDRTPLAPARPIWIRDSDNDGVPDEVDLFPFDFDNDGSGDGQEGGDVDSDGLQDYPQGMDLWLNTTIPLSFPAPYAGQEVRRYIGSVEKPYRSPHDVLRVFLDVDNTSASGYVVGGLGADRMIELSGSGGRVRSATHFSFAGTYPGQWAWSPRSNVSFALRLDQVEFAVGETLAPGSRVFVEIGDALGSRDSVGPATRGTRAGLRETAPVAPRGASSFDVAPSPMKGVAPWSSPRPTQTVPSGAIAPGTRSSTLIDANSNAITTQYNHQRKVVRAGDVVGDGACDATNSDGCWYSVFADQLAEVTANTQASSETITMGSKVTGAFPGDIQTANDAFIQYRETPGFSVKVGAFNLGTGAFPTTVPVTGVGFQPKAVLFWLSGRTTSTDSASTANHQRGFGAAVSATDRHAVCSQSADNVADASADARQATEEAICALTTTGTLDGLADFSSMDTDGFTLIIDNGFAADLRIHYLALGGSMLTDATTGIFAEPAATGNQDITTVGFQPDAVILFSSMSNAVVDAFQPDSTMMIGFAAGAGNPSDVVWAGGSNDLSATMRTRSYHRAGESIALFDNLVSVTNGRAEVDLWLPNGFSLNWIERTNSRGIHYLALKGGNYLVGNLLTLTTAGTIAETGFGFSPKAALLLSHNKAQSTTDSVQDHDELSIGAFSSMTDRGAQCVIDEDFLATSDVGTAVEHDEVYCNLDANMAIDGLMGVQSVDSDGFTLVMDDPDPAASFVGYIAFGGNAQMEVRYDWSGVPSASTYTLQVKGYRQDENVLARVLTPPSTWNTRITISATSNTLYTYTLTSAEYNGGAPSVRFVDGDGTDGVQSDFWIDYANVATYSQWDRVILMRSSDTAGSTWGTQIILASGRAGDSALLLPRDSTEPSLAIDASGYLHVVWVSASAAGDQSTQNLVRYTKTIVSYPTQSELASGANWEAVTNVDDASAGYMPTVSTDSSNNPHVAWSGSKTSGTVYYKNKAAGAWKPTVSWGTTYTGASVDVSPQSNSYVSLTRSSGELTEAQIGYRSSTGTNTVNSPKTRTWDGSAWGSETEQSTAGSPIRAVRMAWSPTTASERIVVSLSDDGWLDAYVCSPSCTVTNNIGQVWSAAPSNAAIPFDVAYESASGEALLAYGVLSINTARDIAYKTYISGAWSAEQYLDDAGEATDIQYSQIKLASKRDSNQIGLVGGDGSNNHVNAWLWDGSAFGSLTEVTASGNAADQDNIGIAWESNSGHLLAVAGSGSSVVSREFTTGWGAASSFQCSQTGVASLSLKSNPLSTSNDMVLATGDVITDVNTCYWSGSGWTDWIIHTFTGNSATTRAYDFAWEDSGSKGLLVWGESVAAQINYRTFTAPNTWSAISSDFMGTFTHPWIQLRTNTLFASGSTKILGAVLESTANDLGAIKWDGTTLTVIGTSTFTADTGTSAYESFELEFRETADPALQYTVCKNLSISTCDAAGDFTKWDGTAGYDVVASSAEGTSYASLATTHDSDGDLWIAYAKDVDGSTRGIYARYLDYPSAGWASPETVDRATGALFTKPSIGIDRDNVVHALYERTTGPQLYYKHRTGGTWGWDAGPTTETLTRGSRQAGTFSNDIQLADSTYVQYREGPDFLTKVGAFNIGTGAVGTTTPVTGTGFQPKVVLFWWSGLTSSVDLVGGVLVHKRGFGVAVSPSDRRAVYAQSQGLADPMATDAGHHDAAAIGALTIAGAIDGLADLQSMDPNGFTLVIADQFAANLRVHYLAMGGSDLTNAASGTLTEPGATGNQDIATVGFQPDAVLFFSAMIAADPPGTAVDSTMMIGAAAGSTPADAVWAGGSNDAATTSQTISYSRAGESIALFDSALTAGTATDGRAEVSSWLSNGFRLNWIEKAAACTPTCRRIHYLALKGGQYLVGDLLTQTDTTTAVVESGFGFQPKATFLVSHSATQSTQDAVQDHDSWTAGAFTSATERGTHGTWDQDNTAAAEVTGGVDHDEVYVNIGTNEAQEGLMDVQSVDSGGFTLIMDDADTSQSFVWYLAFGGLGGMEIRHDFTGVPSGTTYTLWAKGYRGDENVDVRVLTPPSDWNTRITISATSNTLYTYALTSSEYNSGAPSIRFVDAAGADSTFSDLYVDLSVVVTDRNREFVDAGEQPTLMLRAPTDATYGTAAGGLYWKTSASETYFFFSYIPEFEAIAVPILGILFLGLWRRTTARRTQSKDGGWDTKPGRPRDHRKVAEVRLP